MNSTEKCQASVNEKREINKKNGSQYHHKLCICLNLEASARVWEVKHISISLQTPKILNAPAPTPE